jgi:hypothetical protein
LLSDITGNVAGRTSRDAEHVHTVFTASGMGPKISLFYADCAFIKPLVAMIFMSQLMLEASTFNLIDFQLGV